MVSFCLYLASTSCNMENPMCFIVVFNSLLYLVACLVGKEGTGTKTQKVGIIYCLYKGEGGAHLIGESPLLRQTNPRVPRQVPS
ncbi:hypothetical protein HanRHA438_Chr15g0689701 [Helianthus annuus]|nr:hypothetical protein HanRHA438_Chr15g0689701 [Helianthus annuus]